MPFSPRAPAWFSITMDCPSNDAIFSVRTRLMKSDGPPAGKGTTNLMERFGNSSAASALDHARTPTKHKTRMSMDMQSRFRLVGAATARFHPQGRAEPGFQDVPYRCARDASLAQTELPP